MSHKIPRTIEIIASTASAAPESVALPVKHAKKITFLLTRSGHSAGSGALSVTGCFDEESTGTFIDLNTLVDNAVNSNVQTIAHAASVTKTANGTYAISLDLEYFRPNFIKAKVTRTTDGTHVLKMVIE